MWRGFLLFCSISGGLWSEWISTRLLLPPSSIKRSYGHIAWPVRRVNACGCRSLVSLSASRWGFMTQLLYDTSLEHRAWALSWARACHQIWCSYAVFGGGTYALCWVDLKWWLLLCWNNGFSRFHRVIIGTRVTSLWQLSVSDEFVLDCSRVAQVLLLWIAVSWFPLKEKK